MKPISTFLFLALGAALGSCSAPGTEQREEQSAAAPQAYGGTPNVSTGDGFSPDAASPQGKFLAIRLDNPTPAQPPGDPRLPASRSAYQLYKKLTPAERETYPYLKVSVPDATGPRDYSFKTAELALAERAESSLQAFLGYMKKRDYTAAAAAMNSVPLGGMSRDSVPVLMARMGGRIDYTNAYELEGVEIVNMPLNSKGLTQELVRFMVSVPNQQQQEKNRLDIVIDPQKSTAEQFLYGFMVTK